MTYVESEKIGKLVAAAENILIIQADNPDADSLGSALALEAILTEEGKKASMYCSVEMPQYLRYLKGWDRVVNTLPNKFDLSIVVDASTMTLLEKLSISGSLGSIKSKPVIVLDHHALVENQIDFAEVIINDDSKSSAGEVIYLVAKDNGWQLPLDANEAIATSILGDTQGLTNNLATANTYRLFAELIDSGVNRPSLEEIRRDYSRMPQIIYKFKAELIQRTEFYCSDKLAIVRVSQTEINQYSPLYNPAPLIQTDMLQIEGVEVAIVLKHYGDGKITGAIRSNNRSPIAGLLAETLGGGGHNFASGFKITDGTSFDAIKQLIIEKTEELLKQ